MSVLLPAALLALAVLFFVLFPLAVGEEAPMAGEAEELTEAQHRRRIALLALRDVEYDYQAGKLDDEDYQALKVEISGEALAAIDAEEAEWVAAGTPGSEGERLRPEGSGELEAEIAALRASIREGVICPQCAHPNARGSRFCGDCGAGLPTSGGAEARTA